MGAKRKLLVLAIAIVIAYFGAQQFGLFSSLDRIADIDARYGLSDGMLAPAEMASIEKYEAELKAASSGFLVSDSSRKIGEVKLELAEMQKSMLALREHSAKINFSRPDCSVAGMVALAKKDAEAALGHAEAATEKRSQIGNVASFREITGKDFDTTMAAVNDALGESVKSLNSLCR
ncbi:MAG: hypothetical protein HY544_04570 [Candidatus Diapherotrites archaeon]|uniref:Uncharacterized protein n=1 Tax=Candidatus Iainarchaeum sp. TaxID=3101447 RepID=A0A8T3YPS9_9ARCH|nr:hypothetical protein [Candidatus Diapherotrites archaeon]